jgi:hypothetical protein
MKVHKMISLSRISRVGFIYPSFLLLMLVIGCGSSGPSKTEAEIAINDLSAQFSNIFGDGHAPHAVVTNLECSYHAIDVFDCSVLMNKNNKDTRDNYRFSKIGMKWVAEQTN